MEIRLWGTRGSIPSPGPATVRYGGNTSCVEVLLLDGTRLILDAGSGIRKLGVGLGPSDATLLLSHYHWDHIQGLPFFAPVFSPASALRVIGPAPDGFGPAELLARQMGGPFFPVPASGLCGIASFRDTPRDAFQIGDAKVEPCVLAHPGLTFGYRITEGDATFVYISDNEVDAATPEMLASIVELARDADLLLHDCQYTEEEYVSRQGWGHSSPRQVAHLVRESGCRHLLLFHHDPEHDDEQVEALADDVRSHDGICDVSVAREGATLQFGRTGVSMAAAAVR